MVSRRIGCIATLALASVLACALRADAAERSWAAPEIRAVTQAGVLGSSASSFAPQAPLTQSALAAAIKATDAGAVRGSVDGQRKGPVGSDSVTALRTFHRPTRGELIGALALGGGLHVAIDASLYLIGVKGRR